MTTTLDELRGMTAVELARKAEALKQQLFQLRVQAKLGRLEKGHELRHVRRDIARVLTVRREAEGVPGRGVR
ncbi:MAG: 50S ribosomal protein L29 [Candidatus Omnitrophica bacterium]|nr:50S ribosomal protein L29 [Candidatus Omnitrophota bacterium]